MNKIEKQEKDLIAKTLESHRQNKKKAAKELGITVKDLEAKIKRYNIGMHKAVESALKSKLSKSDKQAILEIFGNVESIPLRKKKEKPKRVRRYRKLTSVSSGKTYKQKYYELLKKYKEIID